MSNFLKTILDGINVVTNNYGWAVILFTLLIRMIIFPLDYRSRVAMRKTTKLQPKMDALKKKYGKDQEKLNAKMSELYRKEGISPLSSCLPMLISLPVLFAMFGAMRNVAYEQIAQQVFNILQGKEPVLESWLWIKNIWMPDSPFAAAWPNLDNIRIITDPAVWQKMFGLLSEESVATLGELGITLESFAKENLNATIAVIGEQLSAMPAYVSAIATKPGYNFNLFVTVVSVCNNYNGLLILPLLSAVSQYAMTLLQPATPGDANQQSTNNFMKWFFPIFSLVICFSYNAIFALYWVVSNLFAMVQTWGINKYLDQKEKKEQLLAEGDIK